jgi:hypothetical protein
MCLCTQMSACSKACSGVGYFREETTQLPHVVLASTARMVSARKVASLQDPEGLLKEIARSKNFLEKNAMEVARLEKEASSMDQRNRAAQQVCPIFNDLLNSPISTQLLLQCCLHVGFALFF